MSVVIIREGERSSVFLDSASIEFDGGVSIQIAAILKLIAIVDTTSSEYSIESEDDFCIEDTASDSVLDAYCMGKAEGAISFAKTMLDILSAKV